MPAANLFLIIALILIAAASAQMLNSYRKAEQEACRKLAMLREPIPGQPMPRRSKQHLAQSVDRSFQARRESDAYGFMLVGQKRSSCSVHTLHYELPAGLKASADMEQENRDEMTCAS